MSWYVAPACIAVLSQADALWPSRSRASDGTIGDAAHQADPTSDHNPKPDGHGGLVVDAVDLTHDPAHGCDTRAWAASVVARHDARVKYVISFGRIASAYAVGDIPAWTWRPYAGADPHTSHAHLSVTPDGRAGTGGWFLAPIPPLEEDDMSVIVTKTSGQSFVTDLVAKRPVLGPAHFNQLVDAGVRGMHLSDDHIDAIPLAPGA